MLKKLVFIAVLALVLAGIGPAAAIAQSQASTGVDIPYQKFVLKNGLTLIVHEDHKAPIISFNICYHVGAKNEPAGKTGFAHLFEHLMFNGSENYNDDYFKAMQKIGATNLNGGTSQDTTVYFEDVPVSAIDTLLWMESDRMGHLKGAVNQARLDEQRGVVQNELRQGENRPYAIAEKLINLGTYPPNHPYSREVIGSMEDLNAAKLEDVHKWFDAYYGPNNATIVLAGDIDAKTALAKVTRYFGDIPACAPISRPTAWIAKMTGVRRESTQDRVSQDRLYMVWNTPEWGRRDADLLRLAGSILSTGKTSRLYKRLIHDDQIATEAYASAMTSEIGGQFSIAADAKPGVPLTKVEQALKEELAKLIAEGPTAEELERVRTATKVSYVSGLESASGKANLLMDGEVFAANPDAYKDELRTLNEATPEAVKAAAAEWLSDGVYILEIRPYPQVATEKSDVDRKTMPAVDPSPEVKFPSFQRATLSNGMKVILVERHTIPLVSFALFMDIGYAADQFGLAGTTSLVTSMLTEGTAKRTSQQINEESASLGISIGAQSNYDITVAQMRPLKEKLDASLDLFADVIMNASFPEADFQRNKDLVLSAIKQESDSPDGIAGRLFTSLLYGKNHAYGTPLSGSGYADTVGKLTREDLVKFHKTWFKPDHATLIVGGDTTLAEITPKLEKIFKDWKGGSIPSKNIADVPLPKKPRIFLVDRPDAPQSVVTVGLPGPHSDDPDTMAIDMMNLVLGGDFVSRINMNIREDKHWSYGMTSSVRVRRGQRLFLVQGAVQTDKTAETITEVRKEIEGIIGPKPVTADELKNASSGKVLGLPSQWETLSPVMKDLGMIVQIGLPDSYYGRYQAQLLSLTVDDLTRAARKLIRPESLTWLIVGDVAKIEPKIKELGYGDVFLIDAAGNPK